MIPRLLLSLFVVLACALMALLGTYAGLQYAIRQAWR